MFDIAFSELLIIAVVALIVIGPEKLPRVARTVGHLLGRAQRYVSEIKSEIDQEIRLDDLKKLQNEVTESAQSIENSIRQSMNFPNDELSKIENEFNLLTEQQNNTQSLANLTPTPINPAKPILTEEKIDNDDKKTISLTKNTKD